MLDNERWVPADVAREFQVRVNHMSWSKSSHTYLDTHTHSHAYLDTHTSQTYLRTHTHITHVPRHPHLHPHTSHITQITHIPRDTHVLTRHQKKN